MLHILIEIEEADVASTNECVTNVNCEKPESPCFNFNSNPDLIDDERTDLMTGS